MKTFINTRVLVLGAGKVGTVIAAMLAEHYDFRITLADQRLGKHVADDPAIRTMAVDVENSSALHDMLEQHDVVINALPFYLAARVATAATHCGVHYFDLTEDVAATQAIRELAATSRSMLMPQCGLAPGVIGMLGGHLAQSFDTLYDVKLRVGALARHATNALRYNFTWSVDGVINEYCNPCEAIVNGQQVSVQPLEGYETLTLDAQCYEAFNTSGGLGTLCETLHGKVRNLDYKTMRYPGHRDAMSMLLHDLRLIERRPLLREILEGAVAHSREDVVILFASATGLRSGRFEQITRLARIHGDMLKNERRTAIELSTAAGVVGALELALQGALPQRGFISQETIPLNAFLGTRVGHYYSALRSEAVQARSPRSIDLAA
ncbi:MAG: saccharopine dehydrogenase NADP-binding domain-containing protein [Burkholderiaceae bacterium]|nr:saccharopine dehydrogenase NADP-binding domain-containing protein [Burkholderiaceae bacterium]